MLLKRKKGNTLTGLIKINSINKVASYLNKSFTLTSIPRPSLLLALRLKSHLKKDNYFERFATVMDTASLWIQTTSTTALFFLFRFILIQICTAITSVCAPSIALPPLLKTTASLPSTTSSPLIPTCRTLIHHHHHHRCRTACCRTVCCQCKEGCCSLRQRLLLHG